MTIVEALKKELAHGQFTALAEIAARNGWKMHSAEAAVRVLRRPKHQYHVERRRIGNMVLVRAIPQDKPIWIPAEAVMMEIPTAPQGVEPQPQSQSHVLPAWTPEVIVKPKAKAKVALKTKPVAKHKPKSRSIWTIDAHAIAREIIIDVLRRNARAI